MDVLAEWTPSPFPALVLGPPVAIPAGAPVCQATVPLTGVAPRSISSLDGGSGAARGCPGRPGRSAEKLVPGARRLVA